MPVFTYFLYLRPPPPPLLPITRPNPAPNHDYRCQKYKLSPPRSLLWQREQQARTQIQTVKKLGKSQERNLCVTRKIRQNCYEKSGSISYWQEICEQGIPHSNPNKTRVRNPLFADFFNMNYSPIFRGNFGWFSVLHMDFRRVPKNPSFLKQSKLADLPNTLLCD